MLTVTIFADGRSKTIGIVRINVSEFLNRETLPLKRQLQTLPIEKSADPTAHIELEISITKFEENEFSPTLSPLKGQSTDNALKAASSTLSNKMLPLKISRNMLFKSKEGAEESHKAKLAAAQMTKSKEGILTVLSAREPISPLKKNPSMDDCSHQVIILRESLEQEKEKNM